MFSCKKEEQGRPDQYGVRIFNESYTYYVNVTGKNGKELERVTGDARMEKVISGSHYRISEVYVTVITKSGGQVVIEGKGERKIFYAKAGAVIGQGFVY